jgi:hypothetical protein
VNIRIITLINLSYLGVSSEETKRVKEKEGMQRRRWIQRGNEDVTAEESKRVK